MPNTPQSHKQRIAATVGRKWSDKGYDAKRKADPRLATAKKIRSSSRYWRFRQWFVAHHPICEDPLGLHPECTEVTKHLHHRIPIRESPGLALREANCMAVCTKCHAKLEAEYMKAQKGETGDVAP